MPVYHGTWYSRRSSSAHSNRQFFFFCRILSTHRLKLITFLFFRNPKAYQGAIRHLALPPGRCAMVAAHIYDLRAAAEQGMLTVYVRRPKEDIIDNSTVLSKKDGGEVDYVVNSFTELADIFGA